LKLVKKESQKPVMSQIAVKTSTDRYSTYPSNGLTPQRLAMIFREADAGDIGCQMELYEEMEEKDLHLFSQMQTRKNAVTGLDFEVQAFSDDNRDKEIADFIEEQLKSLENIEEVFLDLLDAIGKGIAVSEIMWGFVDGHFVIEDIQNIHQKKFLFDENDEFKIITEDNPQGESLPDNKFIIHKYKAKSGHPSRAGILRIAAWMYLFKNYSVKDWVAFCEVYGMPLRLGKYNASASPEDKAALVEALISIGTDAAGILPDNATIEFIQSKANTTAEVYKLLADYCDSQISKAVLGQTLTSDTGGGSLAQGKVHNEVRHDLTLSDCKALASTVKRDIIKPLVFFNFGETRRIPKIVFDCKEEEDLNQLADVYTKLRELGLPIAEAHLYKKFGIPIPDDGEKLLTATVTAQPFVPSKYLAPYLINKDAPTNELNDIMQHNAKYQSKVDDLIDDSMDLSADLFELMIKPIMELVDKASSIEELNELLQNDKAVSKLFGDMDTVGLEDLLHKTMFLSNLLGREKENERSS
jgi:phage gp29-like protein